MTTNLTKERTRRAIGTRAEYCPYCDKPLSFRFTIPFCRGCRLFGKAIVDAQERRIHERE